MDSNDKYEIDSEDDNNFEEGENNTEEGENNNDDSPTSPSEFLKFQLF